MKEILYVNDSQMADTEISLLRSQIDQAIDRLVPTAQTPSTRVHEAIRYSLLAGGKRLRPLLVLAGHALFPSAIDPFPAAVAVECVHTYSLIHDDLPCMDDSNLRRGRPTCHKAFDEATALLAGDGLLALGFELLAHHYAEHPKACLYSTQELSTASGSRKLISGQMEDILAEGTAPNANQLAFIHQNKTAAMITASLTIGARLGEAPTAILPTIGKLGYELGMAFQLKDDIFDASSSTAALGKDAGQDSKKSKMTAIKVMGPSAANENTNQAFSRVWQLTRALSGDTTLLTALITAMQNRKH